MSLTETKVSANSVSGKIIAAGIVIAFCYWASTVLVTLLVAVLTAYFLDPIVSWLETIRVPRALGSLIVVLVTLALLATLGWTLVERFDQFGTDWPKYRAPLREVFQAVDSRMANIEAHVSEITPAARAGERVVTVSDSHPVRDALVGRLSSLYGFILAASFVPFLVFFMLTAKRQVVHATMQLFPSTDRTQVKEALDLKFGSGPSSPGTKDFSNTSIGPTFGQTVAKSAIIAIIASLLVISIYIALRF